MLPPICQKISLRWWSVFLLTTLLSSARATPVALEYSTQTVVFRDIALTVTIPSNLQFEILATDLQRPRMLTFAPNGDLLVGSRTAVYRLRPPYQSAHVLVELDDYPHSVAIRDDELLIAQTHGLYRTPYRPGQDSVAPSNVSLLAKLPGGRGHNSRTVAIGPDQRIYLSLGIAGNCSNQYIGGDYAMDDWRGGVMVLNETPAPAAWQPFATGLRNPVGFDWHPDTGTLYSSNNGPDHWGFEQPGEVFSELLPGSFHGMPWFQFDGEMMVRDSCISTPAPQTAAAIPTPAALFPARSAPMGVAFIRDSSLGDALQAVAAVALHGSWATLPDGGGSGNPATRREPKLVAVRFDAAGAVRVDDLVTGFQLDDGSRWARPTGIVHGPDGNLYFASDGGINGLFRLSAK